MNDKYKKIIIIVVAFLILSLATVASYAYFTASINSNAQESVITTGNMAIEFVDGNVIGTDENMIPGDTVEKRFAIINTGTVEAYYDLYLNNVINTFNTSEDLVYELISENGANVSETTCPDSNTKIASSTIGIGQTHIYTLKITFKDTGVNQDDNKSKIFSAKVELEEKESLEVVNLIEKLNTLADNDASDLSYDGVETLGENGTSDNNLRYVGATPNNYILFNDELWRIIGVMNNVEDDLGNIASRVKIMKDEPLGSYAWDTSESTVNEGLGINQWGESTYTDGTLYEGADLMRELNTDYLRNITVGTDGYWYNGLYNRKNVKMPKSTLNNVAQNMIQEVKWNTGSPTNSDGIYDSNWKSDLKTILSYTRERSDSNGKTCTGGSKCNDTVIRTSTWIGKVALMYPSDYGYSTSGGTTTNRTACLNTSMYSWNNSSVSDCKNNSWIYDEGYWPWTLSPGEDAEYSSYATGAFFVSGDGYINGNGGNYGNISNISGQAGFRVRPVVFLKSNVLVFDGDGSQSNPYRLAI